MMNFKCMALLMVITGWFGVHPSEHILYTSRFSSKRRIQIVLSSIVTAKIVRVAWSRAAGIFPFPIFEIIIMSAIYSTDVSVPWALKMKLFVPAPFRVCQFIITFYWKSHVNLFSALKCPLSVLVMITMYTMNIVYCISFWARKAQYSIIVIGKWSLLNHSNDIRVFSHQSRRSEWRRVVLCSSISKWKAHCKKQRTSKHSSDGPAYVQGQIRVLLAHKINIMSLRCMHATYMIRLFLQQSCNSLWCMVQQCQGTEPLMPNMSEVAWF